MLLEQQSRLWEGAPHRGLHQPCAQSLASPDSESRAAVRSSAMRFATGPSACRVEARPARHAPVPNFRHETTHRPSLGSCEFLIPHRVPLLVPVSTAPSPPPSRTENGQKMEYWESTECSVLSVRLCAKYHRNEAQPGSGQIVEEKRSVLSLRFFSRSDGQRMFLSPDQRVLL